MNRLPLETRVQILNLLVEGSSLRATSRIAKVSINTVTKLLVDVGAACQAWHDDHVHGLTSKRIQVDEIWTFTYAKAKNVRAAKAAPEGAGDTWTWTAIDADSKLAVSWLIGSRDLEYATAFMQDIKDRLANRVQLTSDGHTVYFHAVSDVFGDDVDFAQLVKIYGQPSNSKLSERRYSPAVCIGAKRKPWIGKPNKDDVSTSFVERQNLTMRMHMRRFTRLTNAFSKKIENHAHAVALHFMFYNFVRPHKTLKTTPAMAAGIADRQWDLTDLVIIADEYEDAKKQAQISN